MNIFDNPDFVINNNASEFFKKAFSGYLDDVIKPAMYKGNFGHQNDGSNYDYNKFKPLLIIVMLFLKEEMQMGHYIKNIFELNEFLNSSESQNNKMFAALNKDEYLKYSWVLGITKVYEYMKPIVDKYELEQKIGFAESAKKVFNKV